MSLRDQRLPRGRGQRHPWPPDPLSDLDSPPVLTEDGTHVSSTSELNSQDHQIFSQNGGVFSIQGGQVQYTPAAPDTNRSGAKVAKPAGQAALTTSQQPAQVLYATKSMAPPMSPTVIRGISTPMQSPQGGLILSNQPIVTMSGTVFTASSMPSIIQTPTFQPQVVQVSLQSLATPSVSQATVTQNQHTIMGGKAQGKQPQILPKPATVVSSAQVQAQQTRVLAPTSVVTCGSQFVLNSGNILTSFSGAQGQSGAGQFVFGQMVGSTAGGNTPILIQQPGGNPFFVLRPSNTTQTLLPIVSQSQGGTFLLQSGTAHTAMTHAQPQIKIITPQGRMQMQQIQTSSGPKLIAVPMGGGGSVVQQLNTSGQFSGLQFASISQPTNAATGISLQAMPTMTTIGMAPASTLPEATLTMATVTTTSAPSPTTPSYTMSATKKAPKKKKVKEEEPRVKGLDLGELMKDVGLDLEGFDDPGTLSGPGSLSGDTSQDLNTQQVMISQTFDGGILGSTGSHLVAQIQQPLPLQATTGGQLQLVQGPDGQFILQSTGPAPSQQQQTILTQNSLSLDSLSQIQTASLIATPGSVISGAPVSLVASPAPPTTTTPAPTIVTTTAPAQTTPVASTSPVKQPSRTRTDSSRIPLYLDERLPDGWHRKVSQRKSGASVGRYEVFIISPVGKRFRSRNELKSFFEKTQESTLAPEDFDFSIFGTGTTLGRFGNKQTTATVPTGPPRNSTPGPSLGLSSPQPQSSQSGTNQSHSDLVRSLEMTGMASVAAARAVQAAGLIVGVKQESGATQNLLQSIQEPLPQNSVLPPQESVGYSSQLSLETAEADAQISQLLETLQKEPQKLSVEGEKMAEFMQSLAGEDALDSPGQTPSPKLSLSKDGILGFQGSFLRSLSPQDSDLSNASSSGPLGGPEPSENKAPNFNTNQVQQVQQALGMSVPPVTLGGGVPSQMRAWQNLPPNTRIIRGANGQLSLQKIQAIELTVELQANLKLVQARIQEVERREPRTAKDESELAQLQVKQQQILASGRPVPSTVGQTLPGTPITTMTQQLSLSTATNVVSSYANSPYLQPVHQKVMAPSVSNTLQPQQQVRFVQEDQQARNVPDVPLSNIPVKLTGASIPNLTEEQKRIVAEFKQKMALLPPDQHAKFIAAHKSNLIKQLNFQPTQLELLRSSGHAQQQAQAKPVIAPEPPPTVATRLPQGIAQNPGVRPNINTRHKPLPLGAGTIRGGVPPAPISSAPTVVSAPIPTVITQTVQQQPQHQPQPQQQPPPISMLVDEPDVVSSTTIHLQPQPIGLKKSGGGGDLYIPINKQKKIAWVESQVKKDQHEAVNPNYRAPFRSKEDACKRLLRYHVFDELDTSPWDLDKADENFEIKSAIMICRYQSMLAKYHLLLQQESTRLASSSEEVMLARFWDSEERQSLAKEKEEIGNGSILEMPPLPSEWASKYEEVFNSKPPDGIVVERIEIKEDPNLCVDRLKVEDQFDALLGGGTKRPHEDMIVKQDDICDDDKEGRSDVEVDSISWAKRVKLEEDYDEYQSIRNELSRYDNVHQGDLFTKPPIKTMNDDESSDEEFSLRDVDPSKAVVGSILEAGSSEDEDDDDDDNVGIFAGDGDADSVQNAINSILDTLPQGDRIHTPDLNNITGLLDSMDDDAVSESDPATEAAVNSIPRF